MGAGDRSGEALEAAGVGVNFFKQESELLKFDRLPSTDQEAQWLPSPQHQLYLSETSYFYYIWPRRRARHGNLPIVHEGIRTPVLT